MLNYLHHTVTLGVGTRGAVGALAPTTCSWWGQCPHNQSHPVCAILGLTMIYHLKFMNKKATKYSLLVSSLLELRVLVQKWAWSKNFHVRYTCSYILRPHNHKLYAYI